MMGYRSSIKEFHYRRLFYKCRLTEKLFVCNIYIGNPAGTNSDLYKVSFGISVFFTGLSLLSVGVTSSTGVRASIHNGLWAWKVAILALLCVTTFVIPVPHLDSFHTGWLYCALGGACIFLLVHINIAHDCATGSMIVAVALSFLQCMYRLLFILLTSVQLGAGLLLLLIRFYIVSEN